ncbi:MAG TPA: class F sortase [Dehalococcoidia bacterium]|jgi:LPXTG-site transpeptidase (sortase) family protein|nr:class F sortase [Dehalococcoidia bacterium]
MVKRASIPSASLRRTLTGACALFVVLLLAACGGKSNPTPAKTVTGALQQTPGAPTPFSASLSTPAVAAASPTPAATPTETPDDSPMARLVIPKIKVDAPFVTLGIIASTNTMDSPKTKDDVGYYDFTPRPGYGGNTVLSGHVDWFTGDIGVFYYLKNLDKGDEIDIVLQDGKKYRYSVTSNDLYDADSAPVDQIIGDTPVESVTLITCEGVFNRASAEYNKRRVVRAERIYP